jgi:hypothetical protein
MRKLLWTDLYSGIGAAATPGPELGGRPKTNGGGPSPFVVVGAALAGGIALAKLIDWRGHAHPRG